MLIFHQLKHNDKLLSIAEGFVFKFPFKHLKTDFVTYLLHCNGSLHYEFYFDNLALIDFQEQCSEAQLQRRNWAAHEMKDACKKKYLQIRLYKTLQ